MGPKFLVRVELDKVFSCDQGVYQIVDHEGAVLDAGPEFTEIDISLRSGQPVAFRAKMSGRSVSFLSTILVGTLAAFTAEELADELIRRGHRFPLKEL